METKDLEREFLARVFYRRGGMTISESYVYAKSLGANVEWFADDSSRLVWTAAEQLFAESGSSSVTLHLLTKRATALAAKSRDRDIRGLVIDKSFFDKAEKGVASADDIGGYCRLLRNATISRKCLEAFQEANDSFNNDDDAVGTAAKLINTVQSVMKGERQRGLVSISDISDEVLRQYENAYHHVQELGETDYTPGLPLPWRKLAYAMNGFPSVLTILAARPGVGKTSLAVEMMRFWMDHGIKVVFNSLDMAGVEFMKRQVSEMSQISSRKLQFGKSSKEDWEKYDRPGIVAAIDKLKQWEQDHTFTLFTEPDIDILKANVKVLKDQGLIDVLVVDYIQLMSYRGAERLSKQQVVTRVSNMLHAITTEFGIPVLALSQINRDSSKEGVAPQLHDIKDSGAIEQDATNVIILHPNYALRKTWKDTPPTQFAPKGSEDSATTRSLMPMWLILAKARDGDAGTEIPFLVVQNKYSWYQADYKASVKDEMWSRVWSNWKHDKIESVWRENGALIEEEDVKAMEAFNARQQSFADNPQIPTATASPAPSANADNDETNLASSPYGDYAENEDDVMLEF